ncbi:hypothetical protein Agub_g15880, partial [Astrephomene gubernaculifera]
VDMIEAMAKVLAGLATSGGTGKEQDVLDAVSQRKKSSLMTENEDNSDDCCTQPDKSGGRVGETAIDTAAPNPAAAPETPHDVSPVRDDTAGPVSTEAASAAAAASTPILLAPATSAAPVATTPSLAEMAARASAAALAASLSNLRFEPALKTNATKITPTPALQLPETTQDTHPTGSMEDEDQPASHSASEQQSPSTSSRMGVGLQADGTFPGALQLHRADHGALQPLDGQGAMTLPVPNARLAATVPPEIDHDASMEEVGCMGGDASGRTAPGANAEDVPRTPLTYKTCASGRAATHAAAQVEGGEPRQAESMAETEDDQGGSSSSETAADTTPPPKPHAAELSEPCSAAGAVAVPIGLVPPPATISKPIAVLVT